LGCQPFSFCYHIVFVPEGASIKDKERVKEKKRKNMTGTGGQD
jgi:hypothetical protein